MTTWANIDSQFADNTNPTLANLRQALKDATGDTVVQALHAATTKAGMRSAMDAIGAGDAGDFVSMNGSHLAGFRNLLINGNFRVNTRVWTSGGATGTPNQYTLDRWRVVTSGQAISWSASGPDNVVTAPGGGIEQVVEGAAIAGGTYTLSWTGTATATVNGSGVSNGGQVTLTANTNATVRFSNGTVSLAQLEPGSRATPFERRGLAVEEVLCARYCQQSGVVAPSGGFTLDAGNGFGVAHPTALFRAQVQFPVPMRTTPAITIFDAAGASARLSYFVAAWTNDGTIGVGPTATRRGFFIGHSIASSVATQFMWVAEADL